MGGGGGVVEFDAEFKFAKIQNSHLWGGGGFAEFDAEFKFAKIQNSHGGGLQNLMPSSNLLKSKIPICGGGRGLRNLMPSSNLLRSKIPILGGGGWWNQFPTFDAESNFAKKKKKNFFANNFLSFWAKMCLGMGMVFDFEYRVVRYTKYSEPQSFSVNEPLLVYVFLKMGKL